jgi:hypothetical protein
MSRGFHLVILRECSAFARRSGVLESETWATDADDN